MPLSDAAIDRLRRIPRLPDNPHIICGARPGKPMVSLRKAWLRIRTAARMPDLRIHDVRRTVGSWLVQDGRSLHLVGAVLNHQDTKTTAGYAYFQTEDREQALTAHGQKILSFTTNLRGAQDSRFLRNVRGRRLRTRSRPLLRLARPTTCRARSFTSSYGNGPSSRWLPASGVSDVGLSKISRRAMIPIPNRRYWARLDSGQDVKAKALPPAPKRCPEKIRIRGRTQRRHVSISSVAASTERQAA